jgi:hypothetical protein
MLGTIGSDATETSGIRFGKLHYRKAQKHRLLMWK